MFALLTLEFSSKINKDNRFQKGLNFIQSDIFHAIPLKQGTLPKILRMKPGEYSIKVSLDESSWVPRQFNVKIVRGETISLNANLEKKTGGLNIYTEPNTGNAKVFFDDSQDERCMAPCTLDKIPICFFENFWGSKR